MAQNETQQLTFSRAKDAGLEAEAGLPLNLQRPRGACPLATVIVISRGEDQGSQS